MPNRAQEWPRKEVAPACSEEVCGQQYPVYRAKLREPERVEYEGYMRSSLVEINQTNLAISADRVFMRPPMLPRRSFHLDLVSDGVAGVRQH